MLDLRSPRERLGMLGVGALLLFGAGYIGLGRLRQPGPVSIQTAPVALAPETSPKASPELPPSEVVVDVSGAVKKSGVLHLSSGTRVEDAVKEAGAAADADLESLNLAAKLEDGTVVYVPHKDATLNKQPVPEEYAGGASAPSKYATTAGTSKSTSSGRSSSGPKRPVGKVSLNTGTLAQLETLPGVGPSTAQKILDYRQEHGGFGSVDELLAVKGIGEKKLEKLRPWLTL